MAEFFKIAGFTIDLIFLCQFDIYFKISSVPVQDMCSISFYFVSSVSLLVFVPRRMKMMIASFPFPLSMRRHQADGKNQLL